MAREAMKVETSALARAAAAKARSERIRVGDRVYDPSRGMGGTFGIALVGDRYGVDGDVIEPPHRRWLQLACHRADCTGLPARRNDLGFGVCPGHDHEVLEALASWEGLAIAPMPPAWIRMLERWALEDRRRP